MLTHTRLGFRPDAASTHDVNAEGPAVPDMGHFGTHDLQLSMPIKANALDVSRTKLFHTDSS